MSKKLTTDEFITKARHIHMDIYDYSNVEYNGNKQKVCIICPEHGEFWQRPNDHLNGNGCPVCSGRKRNTTENFIKKANKVHNGYFDYTKTKYVSANNKLIVTCPIHGDFEVKANNHLSGQNCPNCRREKITHQITPLPKSNHRTKKITQDEVINRIKTIYGSKYNVDEVRYINNASKIKLYCTECDEYGSPHGDFFITPAHLFQGQSCPKCAKNYRLTNDEFIQRCNIIHDNEYDYSKTQYEKTHKNVVITCPKHGDFLQSPANHLRGQGCPKCDISLLENDICKLLTENDIEYKQQVTFPWLKYEKNLFLDFYLPEYSIAIECQGEQHFRPVRFSYNIDANILFESNKKRDIIKHDLCKEHNIDIIYYCRTIVDYQYVLYNNKEEILKLIKNYQCKHKN